MNTTDNFEWVDWIIEKRKKRGFSQADLAHLSGLSRTAISDYESRKRVNPDWRALSQIAIALGFPPETLLRIVKIIPPKPETDDLIERAEYIIGTYKYPETKKQALNYLEYLLAQEERGEHRANTIKKPEPSQQG
jgi:transcriptional regulator with XRE-family HTH domain